MLYVFNFEYELVQYTEGCIKYSIHLVDSFNNCYFAIVKM